MTRVGKETTNNSSNSGDNSHLIPILVVILCVLSAIVVVGGIILFVQRDKKDTLDTIAIGSEVSESSSAQSSAGKDAKGSAVKDTAGKASNSKSSGAADPCNKIPLAYGHGKRAFSEDEAKRYWDDGEDMVTLVQYCDGTWAMWGQFGTDNGTGPMQWNGTKWVALEPDVDSMNSMERCWETSRLEDLGVPDYIQSKTIQCKDGQNSQLNSDNSSSGGSSSGAKTGPAAAAALGTPFKESFANVQEFEIPECDGHYILVVKNNVYPEILPSPLPSDIVSANYPGAKITYPGACPSLRASKEDSQGREFIDPYYDGGAIMPIYYDYGFDRAGACAARSQYAGSYVRSLTDIKGDYNDPCS